MKIRVKYNQMEEVEGLHNEYPYAYHHVDLATTIVPWHWHEALEFNYILSGNVKVSTTSQSQTFSANEAFFINTNVLATMDTQTHCVMDSHLFHPTFLGGHFRSVFETKYLQPVIQNRHIEIVPIRADSPEKKLLLQKLRQLAALQSSADTEFQTRNTLSEIWLLLLAVLKDSTARLSDSDLREQDRIQTMLSWIHENYADKVTLAQIAASVSISTRECLRCFRDRIRQTPMEYLTGYRIDQAKKLLTASGLPVGEIAMRCGFNSAAYFAKIFREQIGLSPVAYRQQTRAIHKDTSL